MKRGGRRQQDHDENWKIKPLDDHKPQQQFGSAIRQQSPSTSRQNPQSSLPISQFVKTPKPTRNRRNPRWVPRIKNVDVVKPQNFEKFEVGSSSFCEKRCEREEGESSSSGGGIETILLRNSEANVVGSSEEEVKKDLKGKGKVIEGSELKEEVDEIGSRLEELFLVGEEPELEEEVLRINDQLQEDELLAMEAIYGENLFILDKQNGLRSFQIHVHVEALRELTISTKLNSSKNLETHTDGSNDFSYSFKVQYLPPIVLTCLLPKSYPSHLPPYFTISVQWLESSKISRLCSMLDSIWNELPGQEVIYQWTDWLRTSSLSYLGFDEEIVLGPYSVPNTEDRRAVSGCVSPDSDIPFLKSYNDVQRHDEFRKNWHECCICFSEYSGTDFIRLPCQHFFCRKCMKTYSDMHVKEGTVNKLLCPTSKCDVIIPPSLLRRLLDDVDFARWESLMLQKTLDSMSDVVYCPRCETACIEDEDEHAQCSKCFFSFCTLCRDRRHVGISCMTPEIKLRILQERQNSTELKEEQRRREKEMIEELLSVEEILSDATQCPSCKMAISRTEGCNHMECLNCGTHFCYRCSKAVDGYGHFQGGLCVLFTEEMIIDWEREMDEIEVDGRINYYELYGGSGHRCPICGRINDKIGNNNQIYCAYCGNRHCYLCKKIVRRGTRHFGRNGCKQHTAD